MRFIKLSLLMLVFLLVGSFTAMAEEMDSAASVIPDNQLNSYIEVSRLISANPSMNQEEMDALLEKHELTKEQYDSISKQVQDDSELKAKVDAQLNPGEQAQEEIQGSPEVRTKLKEEATEVEE